MSSSSVSTSVPNSYSNPYIGDGGKATSGALSSLPRRPYGCAVLFTGNPTFSRKFVYIRNVLLAFLEVNTKYGFSLFYPLPFPYIGHFNLRIILSPSVFFSFPNTTPTGYGYPYGIGTHRI